VSSGDAEAIADNVINDMPLRSVKAMGGDHVPPNFIEGLLTALNGHFFKGVIRILSKTTK